MNTKNVFVSVNGNDLAEGTIENPIKTLKAAQKKCREFLKEKVGVTIYIREGDYSENLSLNNEDSGSDEAPVTYMAYENEKVRILGGKKLESFRKISDEKILSRLKPEVRGKAYEANLSDYGIDRLDEYQCYMTCGQAPMNHGISPDNAEVRLLKNGKLMSPAGYPNDGGYITIDKIISQADYTNADREVDYTQTEPLSFTFKYDGVKNWKDTEDVWIYGYPAYDWACYFGKAYDIDAEKESLSLHQPLPFAAREGQRFRFVNVLEELDCEDEFFIDRKLNKIYIISDNPQSDNYELAYADGNLMTISGARNISIKNITFSLCRATAFIVENCENVNVMGCNITGNIKDAVILNNCYNCEISGNHIANLGGAGIKVECGDCSELIESGVKVINNEIHDFAKIVETYQWAIAIRGYGNYVAHNEIYNTTQSAIHFTGNCNIFEYNEIHDCLKKTADSGAVGTGRRWTSTGNIFRYNYFHDLPISTGSHTTKGIYLDDIMLGTEIYSNIFENVQAGVYSHGGRYATIKNNIFINCKSYSIRLFTCGHILSPGFMERFLIEPTRKWIEENPKWAKKFPEAVETLNDTLCMFPLHNKVLGNIIFNSPEISVEYGAHTSTTMQDNLTTEDESIFVDYKNKNFTIKNIDALRKQIPDFEAPDFEKIGLLKK